ncbi:nucleotidyltransferase domain protein [bacterium BMS3Bbin09]|nr:nucleotidyltransferase domain protein [bacterium BMS3Bbin09]
MTTPELLETVKNRLISTYNPTAIYLFGSYAWGTPDEDSDLDLLVVVEKSDERFYKRGVAGYKSLRGLKVAKDIIVYTSDEFDDIAGDVSSLCFKIKNEGVKLYEAA